MNEYEVETYIMVKAYSDEDARRVVQDFLDREGVPYATENVEQIR